MPAIACPMDVRTCPDGSTVTRGDDCKFEECPEVDFSTLENTIVGVAAEVPEVSTLVELLEASGLDEVLSGEEVYTVFAPIDVRQMCAFLCSGGDPFSNFRCFLLLLLSSGCF